MREILRRASFFALNRQISCTGYTNNYTLATITDLTVEGTKATVAIGKTVEVTAVTAKDAKATVKVTNSTDTEKSTGDLAEGDKIIVTAEDGTIATYTVTIAS